MQPKIAFTENFSSRTQFRGHAMRSRINLRLVVPAHLVIGTFIICTAIAGTTTGWTQNQYRALDAQKCAVVSCGSSSGSSNAPQQNGAQLLAPILQLFLYGKPQEEAARQVVK
jgi:hypothetical protein